MTREAALGTPVEDGGQFPEFVLLVWPGEPAPGRGQRKAALRDSVIIRERSSLLNELTDPRPMAPLVTRRTQHGTTDDQAAPSDADNQSEGHAQSRLAVPVDPHAQAMTATRPA